MPQWAFDMKQDECKTKLSMKKLSPVWQIMFRRCYNEAYWSGESSSSEWNVLNFVPNVNCSIRLVNFLNDKDSYRYNAFGAAPL